MNSVSRTLTVSFLALCAISLSAQVTSNSTTTGPNGNSAIRSTVRTPGGTNSSVTGANGNTATRSTTYGGGKSSSTVTGPNGNTANRTVTGRGTGTVTANSTGARGAKRTRVTTR